MHVALGLRAHSGWAALVAVGGPPGSPAVVERARIELADAHVPRPFQPYHVAAEMPFKKAEEYIRRTIEQTRESARRSLERIIVSLQARGDEVVGCGILLGSGRRLGKLEEILAAHPLIHTAEGEFFRGALLGAAERLKLRVTGIKERELISRAESELGFSPTELQLHLAEFKKSLGPPWREDQKFAALAAWLALAAMI